MKEPEFCMETKKQIKELDRATLKKILDNIHDEILVNDSEGYVIYVNDAIERHCGLKPEEIIGGGPWRMAEKGYCFPAITPIILRDKKPVTLEQKTNLGIKLVATGIPVFDDKGKLELIVQTYRDITQLEETKKDLEETKELMFKYKQEVVELRKKKNMLLEDMIAHSEKTRDLLELAHKAAGVDSNILILGESGTGKSLIAQHIHKMSSRKKGPFITINCAAIPEELLESELFGYVPGAFTGANRQGKVGLIELSNEGTLFLDEVAELPLRLQAKLLDVIQERRFIPVGGTKVKEVDCRIITATNRNISNMIKERSFREDLYYRLNVIELEMIPLRERPEDIVPLIYLFLNRFNKKYNQKQEFSGEVMEMLMQYSWPGNVRELEHVIERLVVIGQDEIIEPKHLPKVFHQKSVDELNIMLPNLVPLDFAVEQVEKKLIIKAYKQLGSSYKVARALNISQSKALRLINKYVPKNV